MSANADHSGDICITRGNNLKIIFLIMDKNVKKIIYFGGPEGVFNDHTGPILLSSYTLTHLCTCEIRKQSDKKLLSLNPKYEINHIWGGPGGGGGGLMSNPGERHFQGSKTSEQSRQMYKKGINNHPFFIYGAQCEKKKHFGIFGGGGGPGGPYNNL